MQCEARTARSLMAVALLAVGCTRVSDQSRFESTSQTLEILASAPSHGAEEVSPEVRIDLCMSGRVDPRSLDEVDATINSGNTLIDTELSVQLVPWKAPGTDEVPEDLQTPWCEGSVLSIKPRMSLAPGTRYRLRLRPNPVGWAGESILTEGPLWVDTVGDELLYMVEFTIDPEPPAPPLEPEPEPERPPLTLRDLFTTGGPFDPERALCSCHLDPDHLAIELLDLRDAPAAFEDLLSSSRPRDTGFPMISPRDPSQSFLVQKLLRTDGEALHGVLGDPMPPDEPLPYADLLAIIQWIDDGTEL